MRSTTSAISRLLAVCAVVCLLMSTFVSAQSTSTINGTVHDPNGAVIVNAKVTAVNIATGLQWNVQTDATGNYQITALPTGRYRLEVTVPSMQKAVLNELVVEVGRTIQQNFTLKIASASEEATVIAESPQIEASTMTVGTVINEKTVQEIPLNGRHFVDLGLLVPGTVTPPSSGFLTAPLRGQGSFAFNTAGQREDTVNFMINGINLNDMVQNQITFQPSINTVSEFRVDNSTYSAEYGRNSGAIVNIATRSGTNAFHGEAFDFFRNHYFDAKNYFTKPQSNGLNTPIPKFVRNQFGGAIGGPIIKNRTFFFASYEGLRQRQGLTINQTVLTDTQRAGVVDPTSLKLFQFIPRANSRNGSATTAENNAFQGSGTAPVDIDQWTGDVSHRFSDSDSLHAYYAFQKDRRGEPLTPIVAANLPGFGDTRASHRQIFTLNESHVFSTAVVNEARLGFNRIHITFTPNNLTDPSSLGMNIGNTGAVGFPSLTIASTGMNFGGPGAEPQGRGDTTYVLSDTLSWLKGRHSFHFGGEARRFNNNNFTGDTGTGTYASVPDFQNGLVNAFSITNGTRPSRIFVHSIAGFVQDSFKLKPYFTLELGMRYDWNGTPSEGVNRFVVFDRASKSLVRRSTPYEQNNRNFQPRVGFAWDLFRNGKTVMRGGYAIFSDQPVTNTVTALASNPPFANPLNYSGAATPLNNAYSVAGSSLAPNTIDPNFHNPYVQSWNLNIQREMPSDIVLMIGYVGSKGTHLRYSRNINQFILGTPNRPFPTDLASGKTLGNITEITSGGNSNYNALWVTANKRLSHGLQFNTSYTWAHSFDYNSISSDPIRIQNSLNPRGDYASSDFDARHRFVINAMYELPFKRNRLVAGWQVSTITQLQSGSPLAYLVVSATGSGNLTGVTTLRPDLLHPIATTGNPNQWLANAVVCDPRVTSGPTLCGPNSVFALPVQLVGSVSVWHFGNMPRNAIIGPGFVNTDISIQKTTKITERFSHQFRFEAFDLFNHPNFASPGRLAALNSSSYGVITGTRFPTGDSGSSRQLQFAMKLIF